MAELLFYEKPGCVGNLKQQSLLRSQGIEFVIRDLLSEPWSAERLRPYFADKPVAEWFNTTAPAVKSGDLPIDDLSEAEALAMMVSNPILIRRPLLKLGELRQSGFVPGAVLLALGVELEPAEKLQECPMREEGSIPCEGPG
ncbi:MAG: ArsC/Spx/MgsR family protein [Candidatus Thiodiazotropha sp.]